MARKKKVTTTTTTVVTEEVLTSVPAKLNAYILIDRSGSMVDLWREAVGSVNAYVNDLKDNKVKGDVTVAFFDNHSFDVGRRGAIGRFENLTEGEFSPRGTTPLFDSVGQIIAMAEEDNNDKTVIVVMTDGHENASKEFTKAKIKTRLDALSKRGWEVIFLGANFDVSHDATSVGLASTKFATVSKNNLVNTFTDLSARTRAYTGYTDTLYAAGSAINYSDDDKAKAVT